MSWDSTAAAVEGGVEDPPVGVGVAMEEREREEEDGEAMCETGRVDGGCFVAALGPLEDVMAGAADERPAPLPSTLPPPIVRLDMAWSSSHEEVSSEKWVLQAPWRGARSAAWSR
jgi:hypothetical protein